ncbi:PIN domain-containing protein [Spirochaetia bacterium]|nr:PIN domain-containing protein [Spirochaetia bacterium]
MIQRIVLDTNVIVSALLTPSGKPAAVLKIAAAGNLQICHNSQILAEYRDVLSRPKLKIDPKDSSRLLDILFLTGLSITPKPSTFPMIDGKDRVFYDTAKACDALLVTGNKRHYPEEAFILTPAEFLPVWETDTH